MSRSAGIDLVRTDEVRASLARHGARYLERIYTDAERRDCGSDARELAARFAAKEATIKALAWRREDPLSWHDVSVERDPGGQPWVCFRGAATEVARRRGVRRLEVSLTPGRVVAVAVALAEVD